MRRLEFQPMITPAKNSVKPLETDSRSYRTSSKEFTKSGLKNRKLLVPERK